MLCRCRETIRISAFCITEKMVCEPIGRRPGQDIPGSERRLPMKITVPSSKIDLSPANFNVSGFLMLSSGLSIVCLSWAKRMTVFLTLPGTNRLYRLELHCLCSCRTLQFCFGIRFHSNDDFGNINRSCIRNDRPTHSAISAMRGLSVFCIFTYRILNFNTWTCCYSE